MLAKVNLWVKRNIRLDGGSGVGWWGGGGEVVGGGVGWGGVVGWGGAVKYL